MAKNYVHPSDRERALIQAKFAAPALDHQPRTQALWLAGPKCRATRTAAHARNQRLWVRICSPQGLPIGGQAPHSLQAGGGQRLVATRLRKIGSRLVIQTKSAAHWSVWIHLSASVTKASTAPSTPCL